MYFKLERRIKCTMKLKNHLAVENRDDQMSSSSRDAKRKKVISCRDKRIRSSDRIEHLFSFQSSRERSMSSAYGKIERPKTYDAAKLQSLLPIERTTKTNRIISVHSLASLLKSDEETSRLISYLRELLNYEIQSGNTYPQQYPLSLSEFQNYFLAGDTFIALDGDKTQSKESLNNLEEGVLGTFYIKPNFPGRCSHVNKHEH